MKFNKFDQCSGESVIVVAVVVAALIGCEQLRKHIGPTDTG